MSNTICQSSVNIPDKPIAYRCQKENLLELDFNNQDDINKFPELLKSLLCGTKSDKDYRNIIRQLLPKICNLLDDESTVQLVELLGELVIQKQVPKPKRGKKVLTKIKVNLGNTLDVYDPEESEQLDEQLDDY